MATVEERLAFVEGRVQELSGGRGPGGFAEQSR
jgi:hypothetical protein